MKLSLEQNSRLDTSPTLIFSGKTAEQLMKLRERDKTKELGGPFFRSKPHNYLERLKDYISNKNANIVGTNT